MATTRLEQLTKEDGKTLYFFNVKDESNNRECSGRNTDLGSCVVPVANNEGDFLERTIVLVRADGTSLGFVYQCKDSKGQDGVRWSRDGYSKDASRIGPVGGKLDLVIDGTSVTTEKVDG